MSSFVHKVGSLKSCLDFYGKLCFLRYFKMTIDLALPSRNNGRKENTWCGFKIVFNCCTKYRWLKINAQLKINAKQFNESHTYFLDQASNAVIRDLIPVLFAFCEGMEWLGHHLVEGGWFIRPAATVAGNLIIIAYPSSVQPAVIEPDRLPWICCHGETCCRTS